MPETGSAPRRARYLIPAQLPRRAEIVAALTLAAVVGHLLFAQLTLVLAVLFSWTSMVSRWRLWWLAIPASAGLAWTLAIGLPAAVAGFSDGPRHIIGYFGGDGHPLTALLHPHGAFADSGTWLPRQFPLALIAASAEAAFAGWLAWLHTDEWTAPRPRPGLVALIRRAVTRRGIGAGALVTRDGASLGVVPATGERACLTWAEVTGGVLFSGSSERDVAATSFQLVHAALRRRKPVIAVDLSGDPAVGNALDTACAATGTPLGKFGTAGGCYEPFRAGEPARRTEMLLALLAGERRNRGEPGAEPPGFRAAVSCLRAVCELMDAVPADSRTPVLDDVAHLLDPRAMRARLGLLAADNPLAAQIAEHVRAAAQLAADDPAAVASVSRALAAVRASPEGRWLRPGGIDLRHAVRERSAVLFSLGSPGMASLVCADILALGEDLRRIGADGDGVVWICGCERLPGDLLGTLITSGAAAGLPVLAATSSTRAAAALADQAGTLVLHRLADAQAAAALAARTGTRVFPAPGPAAGTQQFVPGPAVPAGTLQSLRTAQFVLVVNSPRYRLVELGHTVPARVPRPRRETR